MLAYVLFYSVLFLFFAIPAASVVAFFAFLSSYRKARRMERLEPGSVGEKEMKIRRIGLIVSAVIAGVLTAVMVTITVIAYLAIIFM